MGPADGHHVERRCDRCGLFPPEHRTARHSDSEWFEGVIDNSRIGPSGTVAVDATALSQVRAYRTRTYLKTLKLA